MKTNPDGQYDLTALKHVQEHATYLKGIYAERNSMYDRMEDMFLMDWSERTTVERKMKNVKVTVSPSARNKLMGAIRLMTAADPVFSVKIGEGGGGDADELEAAASALWNAAGRVRGDPVHYDVVRSALLFSEVHISITSTKDLVAHADGPGISRATKTRIREIAETTPILFDVIDPRQGYPELDNLGLRAYYRESSMTRQQVLEQFGDDAVTAVRPQGTENMLESVTLCDYWDLENRHVWINGNAIPILQGAHDLARLPWVVSLVEGGRLFTDPEDQRQPFLYTVDQSGLWKRENLALTVLYTMVFALGANPLFINQLNAAGQEAEVDFSSPGGIVKVPAGGQFGPMGSKGVIDPSLIEALTLAGGAIDESTLFDQTLGESLGPNAPYSSVALLAQAGRLPLTVTQRKASWAIADAVRLGLHYLKEEGGYKQTVEEGQVIKIETSKIPSNLQLEAKLDIALPQDKLQQANVAQMITAGENPLASLRWARENILQIGNNDEMTKEIWTERAQIAKFMQFMQQLLQPPQPAPMPPGGPQDINTGGRPGMGPGMPPGMGPGMAPGGGLPPEQAGELPMQGPMPVRGQAPGRNGGGGLRV